MNVRLIAYTPDPDGTCAVAAKACRTDHVPEEGGQALETALRLGHGSVAEHATFTFAVEGISRACSHQLVRHRLASYCQQSQRSVNPNGAVCPEMSEEARNVFEVSTALSEASYWKLRHFLALRTAPEAQWEIRELADRMRELAQDVAPVLIGTVERR